MVCGGAPIDGDYPCEAQEAEGGLVKCKTLFFVLSYCKVNQSLGAAKAGGQFLGDYCTEGQVGREKR
jgi:hypothetical protein